jgi:hypothetical protein
MSKANASLQKATVVIRLRAEAAVSAVTRHVAHSTMPVAKGYWHWQLLLPSMDRFGTDDELEPPPPVGGGTTAPGAAAEPASAKLTASALTASDIKKEEIARTHMHSKSLKNCRTMAP